MIVSSEEYGVKKYGSSIPEQTPLPAAIASKNLYTHSHTHIYVGVCVPLEKLANWISVFRPPRPQKSAATLSVKVLICPAHVGATQVARTTASSAAIPRSIHAP